MDKGLQALGYPGGPLPGTWPDVGSGGLGALSVALPGHDGQPSCLSGVSEPAGAGFYGDCVEPGLGLGYHLCLDPRGLAVSGRCDRSVCPQGGGLVDGQPLDGQSGL